MSLSIGNELKDGFKETNAWVRNGINWVSDLEHFYRERALIELEYATKLQTLCKESFKKKLKSSASLSVGDDPVVTPGSLESASLVAWNEVLSQTESMAKIHKSLSADLTSKVGEELSKIHNKYEAIRGRYETFNTEVIRQRDAYYDEMSKSKKNYDSLCQSMENQRVKLERSGEKGQKKLKDKEVEMNIAKNEYLIKINIANRLKDKYYYQDLPEILDGLQDLNQSKVERINRVWLSASQLERNHLQNLIKTLEAADSVVQQNENTLDTAMFIKHNIRQWSEPQDFYYIPSSIWHDDETMITEALELYDLKKKLNKLIPTYEKLEDLCANLKSLLGELQETKKQYLQNKNMTREELFKYDELISRYITQLVQFVTDDSRRVIAEVEIETIQNAAAGKDLALDAPIETKKKSAFGFLKPNKKSHRQLASEANNLTTTTSNATTLTHHSSNGAGRLFGALRNRGQSMTSSNHTTSDQPTAKALYRYESTGDDEISINPGETFTVTELDDGSGWTKILSSIGEEGLVPTSYLELHEVSLALTPKKQGPKVAPRRGAKKVKYCEALYEYSSAGDDEIDLLVGDKLVVISEDDGSGWTEGEVDGRRGLFPTAYVKML